MISLFRVTLFVLLLSVVVASTIQSQPCVEEEWVNPIPKSFFENAEDLNNDLQLHISRLIEENERLIKQYQVLTIEVNQAVDEGHKTLEDIKKYYTPNIETIQMVDLFLDVFVFAYVGYSIVMMILVKIYR